MVCDYYETHDGKEVVGDEFSSIEPERLRRQIKNKLLHFSTHYAIQQLRQSRYLDHVPNKPLWELKFLTKPPYRALCIIEGSTLILMRVFEKKYEGAIKQREITTAMNRAQDWWERNKK